jgi:hypothetical protein
MTLRWLAVGLSLCFLASCTTEGPPRVEATAETEVGLEAGQSQTLRFEVEAEAIGGREEGFRVTLSQPSLVELSQLGVTVERSWAADGQEANDWPERITIEAGEVLVGDFDMTLTNTSQEELDLRVVVRVRGQGDIGSAGSADRLRLEITQR